jgi:hypothetical protein
MDKPKKPVKKPEKKRKRTKPYAPERVKPEPKFKALINRKWFPDEIADKLDEWSKREDSQWLGSFLIEIEAPCHTYLARWADESEKFATTLRIAKWRIAERNRKSLHKSEYNSVQFQREIAMYDSILKAHDREEKEFEASLKDKQNTNVNEEALKSAQSILTMIAAFQNKKS